MGQGGVRWVRDAAQALADFLVDEVCHACSRRVARSAHTPVPDDGARCRLAEPVESGWIRLVTHPLCRACVARLVEWKEPVIVGTVLGDGSVSLAAEGRIPPSMPGVCTREEPLVVHPTFVTDDRLLNVVHLVKFARQERLIPWLARAAERGLPRHAVAGWLEAPLLVPVPMDRGALRRRGFNQAERLAVHLARAWGVPVAPDALLKRRPTLAQSSLGLAERVRNMSGAVAAGPASVRGRRVLVIDDLVTTGATVAACAAALLAAGAESVGAVCIGYRP